MTDRREEMQQPITGHVAQILNERELAINRGSADGVDRGMRFKVLAEAPVEIVDPETNEPLGAVDREKVRVRAVEVYNKYSVCRTYETRVVGNIDLSAFERSIQTLSPRREIPVTLKTGQSQLPEPLPEEESYVKRGDRVVQIADSV